MGCVGRRRRFHHGVRAKTPNGSSFLLVYERIVLGDAVLQRSPSFACPHRSGGCVPWRVKTGSARAAMGRPPCLRHPHRCRGAHQDQRGYFRNCGSRYGCGISRRTRSVSRSITSAVITIIRPDLHLHDPRALRLSAACGRRRPCLFSLNFGWKAKPRTPSSNWLA